MKPIVYDQKSEIDITPFSALVGEDIVSFIFEHAPRKVLTRVARALDHYVRSQKLDNIDEEMGAIRLIAGEEELVVAIFEWLKLHKDDFPEHKDFVGKFKNHMVKLAFYPVLRQFRFILSGMFEHGFTLDGLDDVISWTAKPVVDGDEIRLALYDDKGTEMIRSDPFAVDISRGEIRATEAVPLMLADLQEIIKSQLGGTLRQFLSARAEFRNHLLYATDGGSATMGDSLGTLRKQFEETYHDLLWVLALVVGGKPPSKGWGIASQFIALYRLALVEAGILKADNTIAEPVDEEEDKVRDMATFLYFAYGSNMMTARLTDRCASAKPVGMAFAENHQLTFWKPSDDGSGKGHLIESEGTSQAGVLYEINVDDRAELDSFEGVGNGYRREDNFPVRRASEGEVVNAVTYLATGPDEKRQPYDWYLALIVTGAREHGLGDHVIGQLISTPYNPDPMPKRKRRLQAIDLLARAGTDIATALKPPAAQPAEISPNPRAPSQH